MKQLLELLGCLCAVVLVVSCKETEERRFTRPVQRASHQYSDGGLDSVPDYKLFVIYGRAPYVADMQRPFVIQGDSVMYY